MNDKIKALKDPEFRTDSDTGLAGMHDIEDAALTSITGGCVPSCGGGGGGGPTTRATSCMPPGSGNCP